MRRVLKIAVVFAILGIVANVLIAWAFAALENPTSGSMAFMSKIRAHYWDDQWELDSSILRDDLWVNDAQHGVGCDVISITADSFLLENATMHRGANLLVRRAGWPKRSFAGYQKIDAGTTSMHWAIKAGEPDIKKVAIRSGQILAGGVPPMLPLKPIWRGFIENSIIMAIATWVSWVILMLAVRWNRTRRGRCWNCSYPVGTSEMCTECGRKLCRRRKLEVAAPAIR